MRKKMMVTDEECWQRRVFRSKRGMMLCYYLEE
jgi:hypothetical protein